MSVMSLSQDPNLYFCTISTELTEIYEVLSITQSHCVELVTPMIKDENKKPEQYVLMQNGGGRRKTFAPYFTAMDSKYDRTGGNINMPG